MKEREHFIDVAKAIGIFLVICGHYVYNMQIPHEGEGAYLWHIAYTVTLFHMPLFYLISGYLFKSDTSWKDFFRNSLNRLVIPYIMICITVLTIGTVSDWVINELSFNRVLRIYAHNLFGIVTGYDASWSYMQYCSPMWFVYSLIFVRLAYKCITNAPFAPPGGGRFCYSSYV